VRPNNTLAKIFSTAQVPDGPVMRVNMLGDGFCGWYLIMLWSWLNGTETERADRYHTVTDTIAAAQAVFREEKVAMPARELGRVPRYHLMEVAEAAYMADYYDFNLLVWTKIVGYNKRTKQRTSQWSANAYSYSEERPDRPWLMIYHHGLHWQTFGRYRGGGTSGAFDIFFRRGEVESIMRAATLGTDFFQIDLKAMLEGALEDIAISADNYRLDRPEESVVPEIMAMQQDDDGEGSESGDCLDDLIVNRWNSLSIAGSSSSSSSSSSKKAKTSSSSSSRVCAPSSAAGRKRKQPKLKVTVDTMKRLQLMSPPLHLGW